MKNQRIEEYGLKIKVINGPNLNMLGIRKTDVYGTENLESINKGLTEKAEQLGIEISFFQSNHEGALIDCIHECYESVDGIVLNAGALSHYSYALRDAIEAVKKPTVEIHISNIYAREEAFRHESVLSPVCIGVITGFGIYGYELALEAVKKRIEVK